MGTRPHRFSTPSPGHPTADLTEHTVVHRAMTADLNRLAAVATRIAPRAAAGSAPHVRAFGEYLDALATTIGTDLRVDLDLMMILADDVDVPETGLAVGLLELTRTLQQAGASAAAADTPDPKEVEGILLPALLTKAAELLSRLITEYESLIFPLIRHRLRPVDYRRARAQFRAELPPGLLAFVMPWTVVHAAGEERAHLHDPTTEVACRIFQKRFDALESVVFGRPSTLPPSPLSG